MKPLFESYILVDFQNLLWRTWMVSTGEEITRSDGYPSKHVFNFFRSVNKIKKSYSGTLCFFLEGGEKERYELFPEYKAGRNKERDFNPEMDVLEMIRLFSCRIITPKDAEADDGIATFVTQNKKARHTIISADKDLWALKTPKVRIVSFNNEISHEKVVETFKVEPNQVPLAKALKGDSSDGIPGVPRLRWQDLENTMKSCYTPEDLYANLGGVPTKTAEKLKEYETQVKTMYKVATLKTACELKVEEIVGNSDKLTEFVNKFECVSLVNQVHNLTNRY